jgi:hypothetical protein
VKTGHKIQSGEEEIEKSIWLQTNQPPQILYNTDIRTELNISHLGNNTRHRKPGLYEHTCKVQIESTAIYTVTI